MEAMAAGDEVMTEGSISSPDLVALDFNQNEVSLSPEDLAWVDSCLIKDSEVLDSDWNSLKDALLEILNVQSNSLLSSGAGNVGFPSRTDIEILPFNDEAENAFIPTTDDYPIPVNEVEDSDDIPDKVKARNIQLHLHSNSGNIFLPGYNDEQKDSKNVDLGILAYEMEPLTNDIFKVWDLEIPAEEDDLSERLNKALTENSVASISPPLDDLGKLKDIQSDLLNDLLSGLADLSLDQKSG